MKSDKEIREHTTDGVPDEVLIAREERWKEERQKEVKMDKAEKANRYDALQVAFKGEQKE